MPKIHSAILIFLFIVFNTASISAKKTNLVYSLKPGFSKDYLVSMERKTEASLQGISDRNSITIDFGLNIEIKEKNKDFGYLADVKITSLKTIFSASGVVANIINSTQNTPEAAELRKLINKPFVLKLGPNGKKELVQHNDGVLKSLKIDKSTQRALMDFFSSAAIDDLFKSLFPEYPDKKVEKSDTWTVTHNKFGFLSASLVSEYKLLKNNPTIELAVQDNLPQQEIKIPVASGSSKKTIQGSGNSMLIINETTGLLKSGTYNSIISDKNESYKTELSLKFW